MHFILEGARRGQKCVYINFEEPENNVRQMLERINCLEEFEKLMDKNLITMLCLDSFSFDKVYNELLDKIRQSEDVKRLVIDSFNNFFNYYVGTTDQMGVYHRKLLNKSISTFRSTKATTLITMEKTKDDTTPGNNTIQYLIDGHIILDFLEFGNIEYRAFIPKMRWTNQSKEGKGFEITDKGIKMQSGH